MILVVNKDLGKTNPEYFAFAHRWLLVREGGHHDVDQHQEPLQPHDQPALTDNSAHPESHAEDGHR